MLTKPDISIIIISYNTKKITQNCLFSVQQSLKNTNINYEIIVVDNASNDGSQEMLTKLQKKIPQLKLVFNKKNIGFGQGNNQAVKKTTADYILLLNSDIIVLNQAIKKLFDFYKKNEKKVHFLGGKLLNKDMTPQPSCGPMYHLLMLVGHLFLFGDRWGLTRYSPNKIKKVDWISGACILTKKQYFNKVGGFDEKIFMYMEEIDLLFRANKFKFNTFFYPEAKFIHLGSASSNQKRTYPVLQVYQGLIYFYKKHFSKNKLKILKIMLELKAIISLVIGKVTKNQYLIKTYEKAWRIAQEA